MNSKLLIILSLIIQYVVSDPIPGSDKKSNSKDGSNLKEETNTDIKSSADFVEPNEEHSARHTEELVTGKAAILKLTSFVQNISVKSMVKLILMIRRLLDLNTIVKLSKASPIKYDRNKLKIEADNVLKSFDQDDHKIDRLAHELAKIMSLKNKTLSDSSPESIENALGSSRINSDHLVDETFALLNNQTADPVNSIPDPKPTNISFMSSLQKELIDSDEDLKDIKAKELTKGDNKSEANIRDEADVAEDVTKGSAVDSTKEDTKTSKSAITKDKKSEDVNDIKDKADDTEEESVTKTSSTTTKKLISVTKEDNKISSNKSEANIRDEADVAEDVTKESNSKESAVDSAKVDTTTTSANVNDIKDMADDAEEYLVVKNISISIAKQLITVTKGEDIFNPNISEISIKDEADAAEDVSKSSNSKESDVGSDKKNWTSAISGDKKSEEANDIKDIADNAEELMLKNISSSIAKQLITVSKEDNKNSHKDKEDDPEEDSLLKDITLSITKSLFTISKEANKTSDKTTDKTSDKTSDKTNDKNFGSNDKNNSESIEELLLGTQYSKASYDKLFSLIKNHLSHGLRQINKHKNRKNEGN